MTSASLRQPQREADDERGRHPRHRVALVPPRDRALLLPAADGAAEGRVLDRPAPQPRRAAAEGEGGEEHERRRRQERQREPGEPERRARRSRAPSTSRAAFSLPPEPGHDPSRPPRASRQPPRRSSPRPSAPRPPPARPLAIEGGGTRGLGHPVAGERLSTAGLAGITLYEPGALTLVAARRHAARRGRGRARRRGPVPALRALGRAAPLTGANGTPTVGGMVATNASGPRRIQAGAAATA